MINFSKWLAIVLACVLTSLSMGAAAQGVEEEPTGVDEMAPVRDDPSSTGWLGVAMEMTDENHVRVTRVLRNSPAASTELEVGNLILEIDDAPVDSISDVQKRVRRAGAGATVAVDVVDDENERRIEFELAEAPSSQTLLRNEWLGRKPPALEWSLVGDDDKKVRLDEVDAPLVIEFWATWCGPCKPMGAFLDDLADKHGDHARFVALSREKSAVIRSYLEDDQRGFPVGRVEETMLESWLVRSYPTVFILESDGTVRGIYTGLQSRSELAATLEKVIQDASKRR